MFTLDSALPADIRPCVLLGQSAPAATQMAMTGTDLLLPSVVAGAVVVCGIALVVVSRRRRRGDVPDSWSLAALAAGLLIAAGIIVGGMSMGASATVSASASAGACDLIDFASDSGSGDALIGGAPAQVTTIVVENPTAFDIDMDLATETTRDDDGLAPFVVATTSCSCATSPLLRSTLAATARTASAVRLGPGQKVTLTVTAATTADIDDRHQGTTLDFSLIAYARQVTA